MEEAEKRRAAEAAEKDKQQAVERERRAGAIKTAKIMLSLGATIPKIVKATGLAVEEIEALQTD